MDKTNRSIPWLRLLGLMSLSSVLATFPLAGQAPSDAEPSFYVIRPNDILEIHVWKEKELSRKVLVRPDGRISLPLVQDLTAAGITPGELKAQIEARLKDYVGEPNVTVIVEEIRHYRIFVTGKVQNPGAFTLPKPVSVLQALTLAGGFQDRAGRNGISVVQSVDLPQGRTEFVVRKFRYDDVIKGKNIEQNIILRAGDVVVVP